MNTFPVVELFSSINGEGQRAGQLAVFVRFRGCNLDCSFCDTKWANKPDAPCRMMTAQEICDEVLSHGIDNVTLTGGEPLLQPHLGELLSLLAAQEQLHIEIETNGSLPVAPYRGIPNVCFTLDCKLPYSGMFDRMLTENYPLLNAEDTVKFVCGTMEDLETAKSVIDEHCLTDRCGVYLSPVYGVIDPADMVDFMKDNRMNRVNLQLQLHKFIWDPAARGV